MTSPSRTGACRAFLPILTLLFAFGSLLVVGRAQSPFERRVVPPNFGVTLETDQVYYHSGDVAEVRFRMANWTSRDAHGWSPVRGGNGCTWRLTIEDFEGNVVSQPGSGCLFAETNQVLYAGSVLERKQSLELTYRNSGLGIDGLALPPGAYRICFELVYFGPQPALGSPAEPGSNPEVRVPIRIEP